MSLALDLGIVLLLIIANGIFSMAEFALLLLLIAAGVFCSWLVKRHPPLSETRGQV
ncbi:MAG TPA: hypothetical protein VMT31_07255 [Methanomicrobiales archaeon]|nr:hypothetical protein [Methanomicrobiales archaeon]